MSDRTNAGYTIINAVTVGKGEIVLGERTTANKEKQYVTWELTCPRLCRQYKKSLLEVEK